MMYPQDPSMAAYQEPNMAYQDPNVAYQMQMQGMSRVKVFLGNKRNKNV